MESRVQEMSKAEAHAANQISAVLLASSSLQVAGAPDRQLLLLIPAVHY